MSEDARREPPPQAMQPVPIAGTVRAAYSSVFGQLNLLARAAFLPFLLSLVLIIGGNPIFNMLVALLRLVPYTIFAIAWHRLVLLGPERANPTFFPGWSRRHWRFLGNALMILAITTAVITAASIATVMFMQGDGAAPDEAALLRTVATAAALGLPLVIYITLRLAFVFPAVSVDEGYRLRDAWRHTKSQGLRLMLVMFLTLAPFLLLEFLLFNALATGLIGNTVGYILGNLVGYISLALSLSVISSAFRACTGWIPAEPAPGPPTALGEGDKPEA